MDPDSADELIRILGILEDFLRLGSHDVVDELARFPSARPLDPSAWAHWVADYLGEQTIALRGAAHAAHTAAVPTVGIEPAPTGELS